MQKHINSVNDSSSVMDCSAFQDFNLIHIYTSLLVQTPEVENEIYNIVESVAALKAASSNIQSQI